MYVRDVAKERDLVIFFGKTTEMRKGRSGLHTAPTVFEITEEGGLRLETYTKKQEA